MQEFSPSEEALRLKALKSYSILDTPAEQSYDDIVRLAAHICNVPVALVTLIDEDRQWFKAKVGLDVMETPRGISFCARAILDPTDILEVPDATKDPRFANNPLVTGEPGIRFYAGAPLVTPSGSALGTVCVIDHVPRKLTPAMAQALKALSRQVVELLALRRANAELELLTQAQAHRQRQLEGYQKRLEEMNLVLAEQTLTDPLTALKNRRAFDRLLQEECARATRSHSPLALLLLDVDLFKPFNDAYGHVAGDDALQVVAQVLQAQARGYDHVARYGGEEFAVVLPDTDLAEAQAVAERIRAAVAAMPNAHQTITASVGVAAFAEPMTPVQLVEQADKALYAAKGQGRNRVVVQGGLG